MGGMESAAILWIHQLAIHPLNQHWVFPHPDGCIKQEGHSLQWDPLRIWPERTSKRTTTSCELLNSHSSPFIMNKGKEWIGGVLCWGNVCLGPTQLLDPGKGEICVPRLQ